MRRYIMMMLCLMSITLTYAQNQQYKLAQHYYKEGEYEKSADLFKKLSDQQNGYNDYYYGMYINSLLEIEEYEQAMTDIAKMIQQHPQHAQLHITYGNVLERQGQVEDSQDQYRIAISKLGPDRNLINNLGHSFMRLTKYDLALETFEKGHEILGDESIFAYNLAEIYRRKNNMEKMIHYFIESPRATLDRISSVQNYFDRYLKEDKESYEILRKKLYQKVQEDPDNIFYPEMIEWVFIKGEQYDRALRQAIAMDRRLEEDGARIYALAQIAVNDKDYDTAIAAYEHILANKEESTSYYIDSKRGLLNTKKKKIIYGGAYTAADLSDLKNEYNRFLDDMGRGKNTGYIMLELGQLEGLYLNELDAAITTLSELKELPGINNYVKANAKLSLGDFYLMQGDVWEATLLYSQVDKDFKEDYLGEKARFKNAKLSYYIGDFEWAQEQFDILKSATTKLISNDAIDLSVFIMDNANLDTTFAPLQLYAAAELLLFQNRVEEAFSKLDSINTTYPDHTLQDDVYWAKGQYYEEKKMFDESSDFYRKIIDTYPEDIRADNALFALANILESHYGEVEEAKSLYEKLFLEYSDSTFAIEARKRYRILRGDNIQ